MESAIGMVSAVALPGASFFGGNLNGGGLSSGHQCLCGFGARGICGTFRGLTAPLAKVLTDEETVFYEVYTDFVFFGIDLRDFADSQESPQETQ